MKAEGKPEKPSGSEDLPSTLFESAGKLIYPSCSIALEARSARGLPSWPKAQDLRSCLAGVRGFESRTPHLLVSIFGHWLAAGFSLWATGFFFEG
jgi:hypothetical protein